MNFFLPPPSLRATKKKRPLHSHSHPSLGCSGTKLLCEVFTSDVFHLLLLHWKETQAAPLPSVSVFALNCAMIDAGFFLQAVCRKLKLFTSSVYIAESFWGAPELQLFFFFFLMVFHHKSLVPKDEYSAVQEAACSDFI